MSAAPTGVAADGADRFFFVHLQKAGGTSLYLRLPRVFGWEGIYPNESDGDPVQVAPQLNVDVLRQRWADRHDEIRVIAGHLPLCTAEVLGVPLRTLTVLREPVARTLSYLRHHRVLTPADRDAPLEAIYDDDFRFDLMIHNHMVKMLGMTADEMTDGLLSRVDVGPEHLERATANLDRIEVVGLQERYADFWHELHQRFGWDLGDVAHANRTEDTDVPDSFRRRIAEDNALDVALYERARALVDERIGPATAP